MSCKNAYEKSNKFLKLCKYFRNKQNNRPNNLQNFGYLNMLIAAQRAAINFSGRELQRINNLNP